MACIGISFIVYLINCFPGKRLRRRWVIGAGGTNGARRSAGPGVLEGPMRGREKVMTAQAERVEDVGNIKQGIICSYTGNICLSEIKIQGVLRMGQCKSS